MGTSIMNTMEWGSFSCYIVSGDNETQQARDSTGYGMETDGSEVCTLPVIMMPQVSPQCKAVFTCAPNKRIFISYV